MAPTIRLGKILGIEVGLNWSLVFIYALIVWSLATDVLPVDVPNQGALTYWLVAAIGGVAFYACLLAHELAHALVARRYGVKVAGISLWLFGGVSRLDGDPPTAGAEALIAGVGPLTSLAIAALCLALMLATSGAALVSELFGWLTFINVALALFNLVPAFPLDGGRLLSSLFWWRQGTRQRGVHSAVRIGRVLAYVMIGFGIVAPLGTPAAKYHIWHVPNDLSLSRRPQYDRSGACALSACGGARSVAVRSRGLFGHLLHPGVPPGRFTQ